MANRSLRMVLAGTAGAWILAGAGLAQAAPPHCENITVDDLRQACIERVARCEPLKSAAERDECYRGRKAADVGAASGPIRLTPNAGSAPAKASPAPAPAAPVVAAPTPPPPSPPPQAQPPVPAPVRIQAAPPVVVRPGQPPAAPAPAPIPQPAAKADPAQNPQPQRLPVEAPKAVRPAPTPAPVPAAVTAPPRPAPGDGMDAVRGFYEALAQADGARANGFMVPEKRNSGAYEVGSMSRYYANMREPLRLISAEPMGTDAARVRYHYVYANGRVCDGAAEVSLSRRDGGRPLIERIRALNGC
ncbi:hypothetical protein [Azospirillum rugosum]|uniref:Uncharacterized protein n=1 Tax=Azospirillum rugosum TaxID=416170 RepID=A0ABS4SSM6_9PROT|nr:hypothetical protein [Azospirillum rugosum]MBP2295563.1 hypothetical protein [Azospirillum rugosum]MDQ0528442.1 hypothetical protein [Azospirillum rugosum]